MLIQAQVLVKSVYTIIIIVTKLVLQINYEQQSVAPLEASFPVGEAFFHILLEVKPLF